MSIPNNFVVLTVLAIVIISIMHFATQSINEEDVFLQTPQQATPTAEDIILVNEQQDVNPLINPTEWLSLNGQEHFILTHEYRTMDFPELTLMLWFRTNLTKTIQTLFSNKMFGCGVTSDYWGYALYLNQSFLTFQWGEEQTGCKTVTGITEGLVKKPTQWNHAAVIFTSIASNLDSKLALQLYLNGQLVYKFPNKEKYGRLQQTGRFLRLGAWLTAKGSIFENHNETVGHYFKGDIANFYGYRRVIQKTLIQEAYQGARLPGKESFTFSKWKEETHEIPDKWFGNFSALRSDRNWTAIKNEEWKWRLYAIRINSTSSLFFDSRLYEKVLVQRITQPNQLKDQKQYQEGLKAFQQLKNVKKNPFIPILMIAYMRVNILEKTIQNIANASGIEDTVLVISQDGNDEDVSNKIQELKQKSKIKIIHLKHPPSLIHEMEKYSQKEISEINFVQNMLFGLKFCFEYLKADSVIFTEDDIWFSPDFYEWSHFAQQAFFTNTEYMHRVPAIALNNHNCDWLYPYQSDQYFKFSFTNYPNQISWIFPKLFWGDFQLCIHYGEWGFVYVSCMAKNLLKNFVVPYLGRSKHIGYGDEDSLHFDPGKRLNPFHKRQFNYRLPEGNVNYFDSDGNPKQFFIEN